ncbi:MAG: hypothetical protein JOZ41_14575 [Chloroflexi bacterium]|nr:hypothetical protein [Chloroflexota bacterium]
MVGNVRESGTAGDETQKVPGGLHLARHPRLTLLFRWRPKIGIGLRPAIDWREGATMPGRCDADRETRQAVEDWRCRVEQGYQL